MCKETLEEFFDRILNDPQYHELWEQCEEVRKLIELWEMLRPKPCIEYRFTYDTNTTNDHHYWLGNSDYTDDEKPWWYYYVPYYERDVLWAQEKTKNSKMS